MKKITVSERNWKYDELSKIIITNEMLPLQIESSPDSEIKMEGDLVFEIDVDLEDFDIQDYFEDSYEDGVFSLNLLELPGSPKKFKSLQMKLKIPNGVFLEVYTGNFPLSAV
ncbi:MAG: hypothetical protein PHQ41_09470, partial [Candidatus Cloacimonetes bacterium]|nr:hypothetical protein [Candidatus Cloacimonadota bacterium]